ncbi:MAG: hypothetical protein K2X45_11305 [Phreatobacter sp.]|nr:hypothetical protein [Phreatobacter sp.]
MTTKARLVTLVVAPLMFGGCVTASPPPISSEHASQPLLVQVLSERIQCELASIYSVSTVVAREMDAFTSTVDLELRVIEGVSAGASAGLSVAFSGGSVVPSAGLGWDRQATRSGKVRFSIDFIALRGHPCGLSGPLATTATGWPESAGTLGLAEWLRTAVPAIAVRVGDHAELSQLDYLLQFEVLADARGGFRIVPINLAADLSVNAKSQTTNVLNVAITRIPPAPRPARVEIVNWPATGQERGVRQGTAVQSRPQPRASVRSRSPEERRQINEQLRENLYRSAPQPLRLSPFIR